MNGDLFIRYLFDEWHQISILELIAVFFAVCEVLLAYKNKIWLYPAGIISTAIYIWLFVQPAVRLYADALLNGYYLVISIYGWVLWKKRNAQDKVLPISVTSHKEKGIAAGIFGVAFALLYIVLTKWTDSNTPLADAFVSAMAWAGMWLLARRKIENWIVLNISNAAAIPLLLYKHMPLTALLTLFLFIVAVFGFFEWRRIMRAETKAETHEKGQRAI